MAIDSDLPIIQTPSVVSSSSSASISSSVSPFNNRKRLVQVATNNSASFIQFPQNTRQANQFVPICRPRTSQSSGRLSAYTVETQSLSNQSKSSANAPTSSIGSSEGENRRTHSQQRTNPILTNPLLNHRKEQPKTPPVKSSNEYSRTTRLCLSSKPLRATMNDIQMPTVRASTAPVLAHRQDNISDRLLMTIDNKTVEQQPNTQYIDNNKYDYITRWLNEVRAATCSNNISKTKRTKRGFASS
jgi:hypothetical protein